MVVTGLRGLYRTWIAAAAAMACCASSATTSATGSPKYRTLSLARGGISRRIPPQSRWPASVPVTTARTPGMADAAAASTPSSRAWTWVLARMRTWSRGV